MKKILLLLVVFVYMPAYAVDADGDGSPAEEEALAGTSDSNSDERPYWWKTFNGIGSLDRFGHSVSGAGDVNNDGYVDLIVGAFTDSGIGRAQVFSGVDGSVLYTFNGSSPGECLGCSVSGAGDVNQDGYADVIVGAPGYNYGGIAIVYSGVSGNVLHVFQGDSLNDDFGFSVSGSGDVNGDGYDDFVVGSPNDDNNGISSGSAKVFSGVDGSIIYDFNGDNAYDHFGHSVSGAGDVNNDGYEDVIIGAYGDDNNGANSGSARVYSGFDGSVLYIFDGESEYIDGSYWPQRDNAGWSVDGGDINNDGYFDLVIGAPGYSGSIRDEGRVRVYSGLNGAQLFSVGGDVLSDRFGYAVSIVGDINGDNYLDIIVGAPYVDNNGPSSGSASLCSGEDGSVLYTFNGENDYDGLGFSASGIGDLDGDGYGDFIIGAEGTDDNGSSSGSVRIYLSSDILNDIDRDFIINSADLDDDNDGMPDSYENGIVGLNPLVNDASNDLDDDGFSNFVEYARGTDPSNPLSFPIIAKSDFDFDGDGDLLFQQSGTGSVVLWTMQNAAKQSGAWLGDLSSATVSAIADADADGDADIFFQATNSTVTRWTMENGAKQSAEVLGSQSGYSLVAPGDLDNDGDDDLVFEDATGNLIVWLLEDSSKQSAAWLGQWSGQSVAVMADVDNDGDDDIVTQDSSGNVNVIEMENGAKVVARWIGQWAGRSVVGAGDADNDGDEDIFMESTSPSGDVMVIEMENGTKVSGRWLGVWSDTEVKAVGDIDQDGDVDLIQQNTSSGSVQVVEIQNTQKVTGRWLGTFAYDVKGVIDADADGDVDVAMQDGSGNVALIELESGAKVGGAKWLGVNSGEMKLFP